MPLPTASEITRLFLYGTTSIPDLVNSGRIRPDVTKANAVYLEVDKNEYMDTGPGRFVNATSFEAVRRFFQPSPDDPLSEGLQPSPSEGYTKQALFTALGLDGDVTRRAAYISQLDFDDSALPDGRDDLLVRSYIWGTTAFQIHENARFHIDALGNRWITNFGIVPFFPGTPITPPDMEKTGRFQNT